MPKRKSYPGRGNRLGGKGKSKLWHIAKGAGKVAWKNRDKLASAFKKWRNYTKTKSSLRQNGFKFIQSATGMTKSNHSITYRADKQARLHKMIGNSATYQVLDTNGYQSVLRQQAVNSISSMGIGGGQTIFGINGPQILELFNNAQTDAGGNLLTGATYSYTGDHQSFKFFLQSVRQELVITNQSQCDVNVDFYLCMSKNTSEAYNLPSTDWGDGLRDTRSGTSAASSMFFPGSKPYDSKQFNMAWKVVHKFSLLMGAGATHIHKQYITLNRIIDMMYADQNTVIKGISFVWMMVQRGQIVSDSTNNNINYAPTELITAITTTWKTRLCQETSRTVRQIDNQETAITTARFVDKVSGAVEDLLVAASVIGGGSA